jgi:hypothetical protein
VPGACGAAAGPGLLFFGGVGEGLLPGGVREEAGDELIGELAEGEVDLGLQQGEGRGVAHELLGPGLLLGSEVGADLLDGLVGGGDFGSLRGIKVNAHGWSFRSTSRFLPTIATEPVNGSLFWEWTRSRTGRG